MNYDLNVTLEVKEDSQNYSLKKPEISEYQTFYSDTPQLSTVHSDLDQSSIINKTIMHPLSPGMTSTPIKERDSVSQYVSALTRNKNPRGQDTRFGIRRRGQQLFMGIPGAPGVDYKLTSGGNFDLEGKKMCNVAEPIHKNNVVILSSMHSIVNREIATLKTIIHQNEKRIADLESGDFKDVDVVDVTIGAGNDKSFK
ncbi:hypothetical protein KQX54_000723 [Cotesia glomerata]|uniref:Uncharacterized protein n=1 Tax=Cotesia glomerata TaxID=32391 RepID=A0AAV7I3B4_COTGL|nr:hypothetical protein KQX54_000723 [Cotesia glomerata]